LPSAAAGFVVRAFPMARDRLEGIAHYYDAVVIGRGLGGLTASYVLA